VLKTSRSLFVRAAAGALRTAALPEFELRHLSNFSFAIGKSLYIGSVSFLTKQEQMVLCLVVLLLLTGLAVKTYRTAHPAAVAVPLPVQKS
jgi:hypothetical protein